MREARRWCRATSSPNRSRASSTSPRSTSARISIATRESSEMAACRRSAPAGIDGATVSRSAVTGSPASRTVRSSLIEHYDARSEVFTVYCNLAYLAGPSYFRSHTLFHNQGAPCCLESLLELTMSTEVERGHGL